MTRLQTRSALPVAISLVVGMALSLRWGRVALVGIVVLLFAVVALRRRRHLLAVIMVALAVRLAVIILDVRLGFVVHPPISPGHNLRAMAVVQGVTQGDLLVDLPGNTSDMRRMVATLLAPFYAFFGNWPIAGRIGIATYSLGIGVGIYGIASELASARTALGAAAAALLWPSVLYRSVVIQREVIVATVMLGVLWIAIRFAKNEWGVRELFAVPVSIWTLSILRPDNLFVVVAVFGVALLLRTGESKRWIVYATLFSLTGVGYVVWNFGRLTGFGDIITPRALTAYAQARAKGTTAYLVNLEYHTWLDVVLFLPVKVIYYLFSPLPWEWLSLEIALIGVNALLLLCAFALAIRGMGFSWRKSPAYLVPVAYLVVGIAAYALIEHNFAAAFRRRIQFTPVILLFAAVRLAYLNFDISMSEPLSFDRPSDEVSVDD